jgi:hypothetical protein
MKHVRKNNGILATNQNTLKERLDSRFRNEMHGFSPLVWDYLDRNLGHGAFPGLSVLARNVAMVAKMRQQLTAFAPPAIRAPPAIAFDAKAPITGKKSPGVERLDAVMLKYLEKIDSPCP